MRRTTRRSSPNTLSRANNSQSSFGRFPLHTSDSVIVGKDSENRWSIYPIDAFQESILIYKLGDNSKKASSVQDALSILTEVAQTRLIKGCRRCRSMMRIWN